jgi:hypothetical protein
MWPTSDQILGINETTGAEVAQSVYCPVGLGYRPSTATDWTTGRSRFDPRQRKKDFSCSLCVQTSCEAQPASCPMGNRGPFPEVKRGQGVTLTTHSHLESRSLMSRSYTSSPQSLHGVLWDCFALLLRRPLNPQRRCTAPRSRHG